MNSDTFFIKLAEGWSWFSTNMTLAMAGKVFSLLLIVWMILTFLKAHKDPKNAIDLNDLVIDGSGKIGGSRMRLNLAFITCTWVLVYYTLQGQLSEWLFAAYIAAFVYDRMNSRTNSPEEALPVAAPPVAAILPPAVAPIASTAAVTPAITASVPAPVVVPVVVPVPAADPDDPDNLAAKLPDPK